jgi:ComF family protein
MLENLLNLFFPKVCLGCSGILLHNEAIICTHCRHELPLTLHHLQPENEAFKKFYGKIPVEFAATFVYFHKKGIVQQLIHNLKYKGHQEIGSFVGDWYGHELMKSAVLPQIDEIIPVPLHKRKLKERGYNQVTTFGQSLSNQLQVTYNEKLLFRTKYTKTQTTKNLLKRAELHNENLFEALFNANNHHKHFLLIDDVLTTGSTIEACGKALLKIPGAKVSIICIAMSH